MHKLIVIFHDFRIRYKHNKVVLFCLFLLALFPCPSKKALAFILLWSNSTCDHSRRCGGSIQPSCVVFCVVWSSADLCNWSLPQWGVLPHPGLWAHPVSVALCQCPCPPLQATWPQTTSGLPMGCTGQEVCNDISVHMKKGYGYTFLEDVQPCFQSKLWKTFSSFCLKVLQGSHLKWANKCLCACLIKHNKKNFR